MKVLCPHCRERVEASTAARRQAFCPRCGEEFDPRRAGDAEAPRDRRAKRRGGREGRLRRAVEDGHKSRRKGKILGIVLFVVVLTISVYFRVVGPLTSRLDIETEVQSPPSIHVTVNHDTRRARGTRGGQRGWNVDLRIKLTNKSDKFVSVGDLQVRFYDESGDRIRTGRSTSLFSGKLMDGDFSFYLSPGEADGYSSVIPYHLPLGMGKKRVKCKITLSDVDERDTPLFPGNKLPKSR